MEEQENTLFLLGMDKALLGITNTGQSVYSYDLLIELVMKSRSLDKIDAIEFVDFNIVGQYLGVFTPVIVYTYISEE
jgi:hypothetical protein